MENLTKTTATTKKMDFATLSKLAENLKENNSTTSNNGGNELFKSDFREKKGIKGIKSFRRKQREYLDNLASDVKKAINGKDESKLNKLFNDFNKIYFEAYLNNDYSLQSVRTQIKHESERKSLQSLMDTFKAIATNK